MTFQLAPLFGPIPGGIELAVIVLIAILLFGANKIPKLARSTGQAMGEFKKGREEVEQELQNMRGSVEEEINPNADTGTSADVDSPTTTETTPTTSAETEADADSEPAVETETEAEAEAETENQN